MGSSDATKRYDVVISGASFAGLALAGGLLQALRGELRLALVDTRHIDVGDDRKRGARAFAVSAASKRLLGQLGVWAELEPSAEPVLSIEITDSSLDAGVRPVLLTYENAVDGDEPGSYIVPADDLERALRELVLDHDGIEIIAPVEIQSYRVEPPGLSLHLSNGDAVHTSLLVGADGRTSQVRALADISCVTRRYPQKGIVTTVAHERAHGGKAIQHFLPSGPFAILPLRPGNRSCITWTEETAEADRILALDDEGFHAEVDKRFGGKLGAISVDGPRQSWTLDLHLARSYVAPRVALLGDAAHVVHPIAGQGVNLALRDVAALTESIADAARLGLDIGQGQCLERYERWRRFDSVMSAAAFDGLNTLFSNDSTLLRALRDAGLGLVDRAQPVKRWLVGEAAGLTGDVPKLLRGEAI